MRSYWTYIRASKPRGTLCIGGTNGLPTRVEQRRSGKGSTFTWKINLIERTNPHWVDLYPTLPGVAPVPVLVPRGALDPRDKPEDDNQARFV